MYSVSLSQLHIVPRHCVERRIEVLDEECCTISSKINLYTVLGRCRRVVSTSETTQLEPDDYSKPDVSS